MAGLVAGIDVGSSSVKCCLYDPDSAAVIGAAASPYPTHHAPGSAVEQDPRDWWTATVAALRQAAAAGQVDLHTVSALGLSGHAPAIAVLSGAVDRVADRAPIWMDRSCQSEADTLTHQFGAAVPAITGNRVDPYFGLPKLIRLRGQGRLPAGSVVTSTTGYLVARLTGELTMDRATAALMGAYDLTADAWSESLLRGAGLTSEMFPRVVGATEVVGTLTPAAAAGLGLRPGAVVVGGSIDAATAALGVGVVEDGQFFEMSGQSSGVGQVLATPVADPRLVLFPHVVPGRWIAKGSSQASGAALEWWRRELCDENTGLAELDAAAAATPPGARGVVFLPHLAGERAPFWNSDASGAFLGLGLTSRRGDLVRAVMEGTAYGIRRVFDVFAEQGHRPSSFVGAGGGYHSAVWSQIKADVTGREILVADTSQHASAIGAALLAIVATTPGGCWPDRQPEPASVRRFVPDPARAEFYTRHAHALSLAYEQLRPVFPLLRQLTSTEQCGQREGGREQ
ncbi:MAG TPA: FGGY family carbohydrate kinase [Pseudonocardiaceae bacterium]|nr:FGGY family carbohydrate kinase [Pseudonocardiaceae bacterium]